MYDDLNKWNGHWNNFDFRVSNPSKMRESSAKLNMIVEIRHSSKASLFGRSTPSTEFCIYKLFSFFNSRFNKFYFLNLKILEIQRVLQINSRTTIFSQYLLNMPEKLILINVNYELPLKLFDRPYYELPAI